MRHPAAPRPRFQVTELEPRLAPAANLFAVPAADTSGGSVQIRFERGGGDAQFQNEVGYYAVDDADGRVDGHLPTDSGYAGLALGRANVVFAAGTGLGTNVDVSLTGGQLIGLYMVSNATTQEARLAGATVFFSYAGANADRFDHVRAGDRGDGGTDYRFEDGFGGGDQDFNDAVVSVTPSHAVTAPGAAGQTVQATFDRIARDGTRPAEVGLYRVDAADGTVGGVAPNAPGYLQAALGNATRTTIFSPADPAAASRTLTLDGGARYAFYYIAGGTADQVLADTPGAVPYFSFTDANPDRIDHLQWRAPDTVGFEDALGGGDLDFNDSVVRIRFAAPASPPPPPASPPSPPDTTPPTASFQLTTDSGASGTDGITNNAQGVLTVGDDSGSIATLRAGFDSTDAAKYSDILSRRGADGAVAVTADVLTLLNGGNALPDGPHTLFVEAVDPSGNRQVFQFPITLDTTPPLARSFDLDPAFDTGAVGDLRTTTPSVTLTGTADAGVTLELSRPPVPGTPGTGTVLARVAAGPGGAFSFTDVGLNVGPNSFTVRAVDAAGNVGQTFTQTITRNTPPTVANTIADQAVTIGGGDRTFNLASVFADAERVLRLTTAYPTGQTGALDINLFANQAPQTVANILAYVNSGNPLQRFDGSIFHRLAQGFVLQGGGFRFDPAGTDTATKFPAIPKLPAVANEPGVSNTFGTIAMAKLGNDPNSATNEFFFNLADNSSNLDSQNGGFTVFGQVMHGGADALDAIAASVTAFNGDGVPGAPPFPIRAGANTADFPRNVTAADLVSITTAAELGATDRMAFSAGSSNPSVVTATVVGGVLTLRPTAIGTATITIQATDLDGATTSFTFTVTVA